MNHSDNAYSIVLLTADDDNTPKDVSYWELSGPGMKSDSARSPSVLTEGSSCPTGYEAIVGLLFPTANYPLGKAGKGFKVEGFRDRRPA
jgi:hypothetical protein